jgi:ribosomal protein S18 acetylase RimI-like enzyme
MTDKNDTRFTVKPYDAAMRRALDAMYADFEPKRVAQGLPPEQDIARRAWLERVLATGNHLVVYVDGALVGHIMLMPMQDPDSVELANFLHQSVRNRGIGTALNRIALELARELGFKRVWLSVEPSNRAAVRSYQKAGFRMLQRSMYAQEMEMEALPHS